MKVQERTIPFFNRSMLALLRYVTHNQPVKSRQVKLLVEKGMIPGLENIIHGTTMAHLTHMVKQGYLIKEDRINSDISVANKEVAERILQLLDQAQEYGFCEAETSQLNRMDIFIRMWSDNSNNIVSPSGSKWRSICKVESRSKISNLTEDFRETSAHGRYRVKGHFMRRLVIWREVATLVKQLGVKPAVLCTLSVENKSLVFINQFQRHLIELFLSNRSPLTLTQLHHEVQSGNCKGLDDSLGYGIVAINAIKLTRLGLLTKFVDEDTKAVLYKVADRDKVARVLNLLDAGNVFSDTLPTNNTVTAGYNHLELSGKSNLAEGEELLLKRANRSLLDCKRLHDIEVYDRVHVSDAEGRKVVLKPYFVELIHTWKEINEILKSLQTT